MAFRYTLPTLPSTSSNSFGGENPFAGSDKTTGFTASTSGWNARQLPTLTERQMAQLKYNLAHKSHEGFLDRVKHGAGFTLEHVLDYASRGDYAAATGFDRLAKGIDKGFSASHLASTFLHGAAAGVQGDSKETFGQLIAKSHTPGAEWLHKHSKTEFAVGLGLDVALDPTSYIGIGLVGKAGKAIKVGEDAIKGGKLAEHSDAAIRVAQAEERAKRLAPDLEASIEAGAGREASRASAQFESDHLRNIVADEGAVAAERAAAARHLEFRFGPTLKTSVRVRTPLKLRGSQLDSINRLSEAAKGGRFTAQVRKGVKDRFHAGWDMPVIHRMKQAAIVHGLRKWAEGHWHFAKETMEPYVGKKGASKLTEQEQAKALAAFDKKGVVDPVTHDIIDGPLESHLIQQGFDRASGSLQRASGYLHAWHAVTERLLHYNEAAGVKLEEDAKYAFSEGRGYVPRRVNPNHEAAARFSLPELAKTQGVQRARKGNLDFEGILQGIASGEIHPQSALHNPGEMLAQIINESSTAQVAEIFKDAVRKTFGTTAKVFDRSLADNKFAKKIERKTAEHELLRKQLAATTIEHLTAEATRDFLNTRAGNRAERVRLGNYIKNTQAEIARSQPLGHRVSHFTPAEVAKVRSKTEGAKALANHEKNLVQQIKDATKPLTQGDKTALQYEQLLHIDRLKEDLAHATDQGGPTFGSVAESPIHAVNGTAPGALRKAWDRFQAEALTEPQADALDFYVNDSSGISEFLTETGGILDGAVGDYQEGMVDVIRDIDSAFREAPQAAEAFVVHHGTQFTRKGGRPRPGQLTDDIPSFISSSTDRRVAEMWAGDATVTHPAFPDGSQYVAEGYAARQGARVEEPFKAVYDIRVPKGTRTIGNIAGTEHSAIDEVILQRGGKLRILSVSKPDARGIHTVKAEFVAPKAASKSVDPEHIKRMIGQAEAKLRDPEALRRQFRPVNHLKAQLARVRNRRAVMDDAARKAHPTGKVGDNITFHERLPVKGGPRGIVNYTVQHGDKGFMQLEFDRASKSMHVGMVRVHPQYQRQGVGTSLYHAAFALAEKKGIRTLLPSDLQSADGQAIWKALRAKPPVGWKVAEDGNSIVRDGLENIRVARLHKGIKDAQRALDQLPPAKQVRTQHAQHLLDLANDPKRIKSVEEMTKRSKVLEKGIANLKPKALRAMYRDNPAAMKADLVHAIALDTKGIGGVTHEYVLPAALNEHLGRVMEALINPKKQDALDHVIRKAMTEWKKLVTTVNPGYWTRNTVSDFWNMYIADVPLWAMAKYGTKAAKLMRDAKNGDLRAKSYLMEFEARGGGSGLFIGDIREMKAELTKSKSKYQRLTGKQVDLNGVRENWGRLVHYMYRTEHEGMSHADAAYHVREAHFDYTDLTEFEQKRMKAIAPFYTWTRKNVPFQLKKLFTRPGRVNAYQKIAANSEAASGDPNYKGPLSVALGNSPLAFRVGQSYVNPQIGLQDLFTANPLTDAGRQGILSQLSPQFKIPLELLQNKSSFTGQPIYGDTARSQTGASWLSGLLGGGETIRNYGKGPKAYPSVPWWANYGMRQIPVGSFALSFDDPAAGDRAGSSYGGLSPKTISYAFGLSTAGINPAYEQEVAKAQADANFKIYYKWLQDQGKASVSPIQPASRNQQIVDNSSYGSFGR